MINRLFYCFLSLVFMAYVIKKVKSRRLIEKESIFWVFASIIIMVLGGFPNVIKYFAKILNIEYAPSLLFLLGLGFVLLIVFRITMHVSVLKEQIKELAQRNSISEKRIKDLEQEQFSYEGKSVYK